MKSFLRRQFGLVLDLVAYSLRSRYQRSILGLAWLVVRPLFLLAVYGLVFSRILGPRHGTGGAGYAFYLAAGLLPWLVLQESLLGACRAFRENAHFLTRLPSTPEVFVLQKVLASQVTLLLYEVFLIPVLVVSGLPVGNLILALPLLLLLHVAFAFGLGLILAWADLVLADVGHATAYFLTCWFWLTPIVYPAAFLERRFSFLVHANPLAYLIRCFRAPVVLGTFPARADLAATALFATATITLGLALVARVRREIPDLV